MVLVKSQHCVLQGDGRARVRYSVHGKSAPVPAILIDVRFSVFVCVDVDEDMTDKKSKAQGNDSIIILVPRRSFRGASSGKAPALPLKYHYHTTTTTATDTCQRPPRDG
jgi:hypothetical protein